MNTLQGIRLHSFMLGKCVGRATDNMWLEAFNIDLDEPDAALVRDRVNRADANTFTLCISA